MSRERMRARGRGALIAALALAALALAGAGAALAAAGDASIAQNEEIRVTFSGGISPAKLPRSGAAPVSVRMGGKIKSLRPGVDPPKLSQIVLEINREGKISTAGLPTCSLGELNSASTAAARRSCGGALIGHGNVTSRVSLPGQSAFASNGQLLAFNGRYKGRAAVLAHVESGPPLPLTYVIVFQVAKGTGRFGYKLIGALPPIASEYGYITAFDLSLGRRYSSDGQRMSYARASCPAPKGFTQATFTFARASYVFENGANLSADVRGTCRVRG
jgi:hypothetical protein